MPPTAVVKPVAASSSSSEKPAKTEAPVPTMDFAHGSGVELPKQFRATSDVEASKRLVATLAFTVLALHALSICPDWALPLCWLFAALAFTFIFEIGHDCSKNNFFRSTSFNHVAGSLLLAPLIQPAAFWKDRNVSRRSWLTVAFQWRKSIVSGLHFSHAVVVLFVATFFPYMLSRPDGAWEVVKYWFIPFALFNLWMTMLFSEGQKVTEAAYDNEEEEIILGKAPHAKASRGGSKSKDHSNTNGVTKAARTPLVPTSPRKLGSCESRASELRMYLRLLSFLRFQLHVPSYHFSDAIYFVKRVWNRSFDEAPTGGNHKFSHFLDTLAVSSLAHGFRSMHIFDRSLSLTLKALVIGWLYLVLNIRQDLLNVSIAENIEAAKLRLLELYNKPLVFTDAVIDLRIALLSATIIGLAIRSYYKRKNVYLVDFITYTPPSECIVTTDRFKSMQRRYPFSTEALEFMDKLITRTGIGENSYFPPNIIKEPADFSLAAARAEAETVMFGCLDELFAATNTDPRAVDILIVNCSLFNPTPSLSAMIVNKYKMREDIQSYNLSGMGCSAGVISVHLAKDLLHVYPNSLAVVISTENITQNWYKGNERGMLVSNCLFRMGGAAVLLSNKSSDRSRAKYSLLHTVRTHRGADDESYYAVYQDCERCEEPSKDAKPESSSNPASAPSAPKSGPNASKDSQALQVPPMPRVGVRLSKDLMRVAGEALKHNITTLAPLILPLSEQVKYVMNLFKRKVLKRKSAPYVPDFKKAVRHFCIHAGGRAVIEAIEQALHLAPADVEPSKATLFRFGNTSSSSIWYELAYMEKHGRVRRSDKVWQIAFGSGFKCNSAVWQSL